jgi:hypothetical protein
LRQQRQALGHRIEQHAKDARAFGFKRGPEFLFGAALVGYRVEREKYGAIGKIGPCDDILDSGLFSSTEFRAF